MGDPRNDTEKVPKGNDVRTFTVGPEDEGQRADKYLAFTEPEWSRAFIQKLLEEERVLLRGKAVRKSGRVSAGDVLEVDVPPARETAVVPQDRGIKYRIYPTAEQQELIAKTLGCSRFVYNKMLELSDANSQMLIERNDDIPATQIVALALDESGITQASCIKFDLLTDPETEKVILHTNERQASRALSFLLDNAQKFLNKPNSERDPAAGTDTKANRA